jgi:hypothetical protein
MPVDVAFLFLWECRLLLCCIVQLLSWLVICVPRVTCDFVSRLGGRDTILFVSKNGWLKASLEVPVFEAEVLKLRREHLFQLSWCMVPGSATFRRVQAQVRTPPSNWLHEMAI